MSFVKDQARNLLPKITRRIGEALGKGNGGGGIHVEVSQAAQFLGDSIELLFVDVGGNLGDYSAEILRRFPEAKVAILEPAKLNCNFLRDRFQAFPNVRIFPYAVSDSPGSAALYSDKEGSGLGSLQRRRLDHFGIPFEVEEEVEIVRFEDFWKQELNSEPIGLCKLDIEGSEFRALSGFGEALCHCDLIQFEFGGANIDSRTYFQDFFYFFSEREFDLFRVSPLGPLAIKRYRESDEFFDGPSNYLARRRV